MPLALALAVPLKLALAVTSYTGTGIRLMIMMIRLGVTGIIMGGPWHWHYIDGPGKFWAGAWSLGPAGLVHPAGATWSLMWSFIR